MEAGAVAETAFYKVRNPARGGREARRRSRAAAASREGGRAAERAGRGADAAGPSQVSPRLRAWPGGGARGGGARARAPAYKRAARALPSDREARAAEPLPLRGAAVSALGHQKGFIRARLCLALLGLGGSVLRDFPARCFSPALIDPSLVSSLALQAASRPRACTR